MPSRYVPTQPQAVAPQAKPSEPVSMPWKAAGLVTRLLGGIGSGVVGMEPGLGTLAAGAIGGGAETLAQKLENPSGTPIDKKRVATEAALSAVPLGKIYQEGKLGLNMLRGAGLAEVGNLARRKAATGDYLPHDLSEAAWDAASVGLGGAAGIIPARASASKIPKAAPEVFEIEPTIRPGGSTLSGTVKAGAKGKTTLSNAKNVPASKVNRTGTITSTGALPPGPTPREMPNLVKPGAITPDEYAADLARFNTAPELTKTPIVGTPAEASSRVQKIVAGNTKAATKTALDVEKAQEAANKLVGKEKADAAKAQTKFVESEAAQAAKNLNAKGAFTRKVEVAAANADTEAGRRAAAAQKLADNEKNLLAIETAKAGREATPPRISESVSAKTGEGQRTSMSRSFVEPKPPETGKPVTGESMTNDIAVKAKDIARQTIYRNKDTARDAAIATGAKDYIKISRGNYRLVFDDVKPVVNEPVAPGPAAQKFNAKVEDTLQKTTGMLPDNEPVLPTAPPAEKAVANEMAPSLERDVIAGKRYTNKSEATAIAKATGGTIYQDGPRRYSVRFTPEEVPVAEPITPSPTIELPKPKDMPRANVAPTEPSLPPMEKGDLTPDEFRRYMDIRPSRGITRTPAETTEYLALHQRINKPPVAEISDYTGGQPQHTVEASIPESQPALPGVSPVVNETPKLAEPKFSLQSETAKTPGVTAKFVFDQPGVGPMFNIVGGPADKSTVSLQKLEELGIPVPADRTPMAKPGGLREATKRMSDTVEQRVNELNQSPQGGAIPARMFKSKAAATAENYGAVKAAKAAGETIPEEGRAIAGKTAAAERKAAALDATSDDLTKMTPEDQSKALSDLVKKFKSSKGEVNMVALSRLGLGAAGAAAGAASTPDDPLTGALLGGAAGAFAPSLVRALIGHASTTNVPESSIRDIAEKSKDTVETFVKMLPDYQRFTLLSDPRNLSVNMWVGPWGASIMASAEHALQGDPRGLEGLKLLLNPKNFPEGWFKGLPEARERIRIAEERTEGLMGQAGPNWFRRVTEQPGVGMTAGDISARDLLMKAGFSEDEARRITLTSEPYSPEGNAVAKFKKGAQTEGGKKSWFVNMALPFYRTNVNQIEQGLERVPAIGFIWEKYAKDIPAELNVQIAKQVIGGAVGSASYLLGTAVPEEHAKFTRKFISDFGGQYGLIASAGFVMGQAARNGKSEVGALAQDVMQRDMPMPSTDILQIVFSDLKKLTEGKSGVALTAADAKENPDKLRVPFKAVPGFLDPSDPASLTALIGGAVGAMNESPSQPSTPSVTRSRYIPTSPKR